MEEIHIINRPETVTGSSLPSIFFNTQSCRVYKVDEDLVNCSHIGIAVVFQNEIV